MFFALNGITLLFRAKAFKGSLLLLPMTIGMFGRIMVYVEC